MLRFLFGKNPGGKVETQRETFERQVRELTATLEAMPVKPKVSVDPNTGAISFEAPDQFADEALALPKPAAEDAETATQASNSGAAPTGPAAPKAAPPTPTPPKATPPKAAAPAGPKADSKAKEAEAA
ncbi:MAG: hypothetical protein AAGH73_04185 [Pseudomonadota bacterium]